MTPDKTKTQTPTCRYCLGTMEPDTDWTKGVKKYFYVCEGCQSRTPHGSSRESALYLANHPAPSPQGQVDDGISFDGIRFWIEDEGIRIKDANGVRHLNHSEGERLSRWFYAWYLKKRPYPAPTPSETLTAPALDAVFLTQVLGWMVGADAFICELQPDWAKTGKKYADRLSAGIRAMEGEKAPAPVEGDCGNCDGDGLTPGEDMDCGVCDGTGKARKPAPLTATAPGPGREVWVTFHDNGNPRDVFPDFSPMFPMVKFREVAPTEAPGAQPPKEAHEADTLAMISKMNAKGAGDGEG